MEKKDCFEKLKEKCPEITPHTVDQMDYYLVGRDCLKEDNCSDAIINYIECTKVTNVFDDEYIRIANNVINQGTWKMNSRTGKNCLFYHGDMMKFDLSSGQFPLLTTKKMAYKSMVGELIGFLRGVDNAKDFRDLGCKFWDANANESVDWLKTPNRKGEDDLGRIYGVQARNRQTFFEITPKTFIKPDHQKIPLPVFVIDEHIEKSKHDGEIYNSANHGQFKVIGACRDGDFIKYGIQFTNTGFIKYNVPSKHLKDGATVKDIYAPSYCDIACMGDISAFDDKLVNLLKGTWRDMISRCYSTERRMNSAWYKDEGVFVDDYWLVFANFLKDFTKIDKWELKLEFSDVYSLDKDFYFSNKYSLETCVWASKTEQVINSRQGKQFIAVSPSGEVYHEIGLSIFANKHNINPSSAYMALRSGVKINGWDLKSVNINKNYRIRIDDQLAHCIAKIKHNPSDRRMIVDHWNPNELHMMSLPPCHMMYQFGIRDGYLDLCMYQRSCDLPLGIPMNIASYALLLELIAKVTGLKAGVFTHFMWNIHIYEDQLDAMKKQLLNVPKKSPRLKINCDLNSLDDIDNKLKVSDIVFEDYQHHDAIKFPFAS